MSQQQKGRRSNAGDRAPTAGQADKTKPVQDAFWREKGEGKFVLHVDGVERGIADTNDNSGVILSMPGAPPYKFAAPESEVIFDAVEDRIGIARVGEFRTETGKTIIPWRGMAEQSAEHFRMKCPPEKEAQHHAQQAWHLLNEKSTIDGLNAKANEARLHLGQALTAIEKSEGQWSAQSRQHVKDAQELLRTAPEVPMPLFQPAAKNHCDKAVAALERDLSSSHVRPELSASRNQDLDRNKAASGHPAKDDAMARAFSKVKAQDEARPRSHGDARSRTRD